MRVNAIGWAEKFGQTEIADFEDAQRIDEQIVRLQIAVQNPIQVQVLESFQCHNHVRFDVGRRQQHLSVFDDHLQIGVHEIEHQRHIRFMAKHIQQADDILVLQFVQQFDFAQSRSIDAVACLFSRTNFDFLHRNDGTGNCVSRLVHRRKL